MQRHQRFAIDMNAGRGEPRRPTFMIECISGQHLMLGDVTGIVTAVLAGMDAKGIVVLREGGRGDGGKGHWQPGTFHVLSNICALSQASYHETGVSCSTPRRHGLLLTGLKAADMGAHSRILRIAAMIGERAMSLRPIEGQRDGTIRRHQRGADAALPAAILLQGLRRGRRPKQ